MSEQLELLCSNLKEAFPSQFALYRQGLERQQACFAHEHRLRLWQLLEEELFNPQSPWPEKTRSYLAEPSEFLAFQKSLYCLFGLKVCYKKALLFQIRSHGLYRAKLRTYSETFPFEGQASFLEDPYAAAKVREMLVTLEAREAQEPIKKELHGRLDNLFWRKQESNECVFGGLDTSFFQELKEALGEPLVSKTRVNLDKICRFSFSAEQLASLKEELEAGRLEENGQESPHQVKRENR